MGHDVHRVGCYNKHRVGRVSEDVWHYALEYGLVMSQELESRLARPLRYACRQDHDATACQVCVLTGPYTQRMGEGNGMEEVIRLSPGTPEVLVDQDYLGADATLDPGKSRRRAYQTCPDNSDLDGALPIAPKYAEWWVLQGVVNSLPSTYT